MVARPVPIRVGGPSGPFSNEISWDEIRRMSGAPDVQEEYTSVTRRLRRVARFDMAAVKLACQYNRPSGLAVMGLDRLNYRNAGVRDAKELTEGARVFLEELELDTGVPVFFGGTGFSTQDVVRFAA